MSGSADALQPSAKMPWFGELPYVMCGLPGAGYGTTSVVQSRVTSWPALSRTVRVVVCGPTLLVSIATEPLGSLTSPDSPSDASTVACAPGVCGSTCDGHVTLSD